MVYQQLRRVYDWYGAADKLAEFHAETGHADLPPYRKAANEWLNRWLRDHLTPFDEGGIRKEEASQLAVLDRYPAGARNEGIHRTFVPLTTCRTGSPFRPGTSAASNWPRLLREKVFRAFPKNRVPFETWKARYSMWTEKYADSFNVEFTTEESIRVHGQLFVPRDGKTRHPALIYVKGSDDIVFSVDFDNLLSAFSGHVVLVLNPRAVDYPMNVNRMSSRR